MSEEKRFQVNAEIIGLSAVVLSLILVAMELRQNTIALEAQAVLELNESAARALDLWLEYPDFRETEQAVRASPGEIEDLTFDERVSLLVFVNRFTQTMESAWVYYERGLIDDEQLSTYKFAFCDAMNTRTHKSLLDNLEGAYRKQFVDEFFAYCLSRPEGMNW
jgi:hypothetical protein